MLVNADFSRRATVAPYQYQWVSSPQDGVERVMLDRVGAEKARATSIVRYAPDSFFPGHEHPGGEEILVLSGTFSEGEEHYPTGWYMRNPPGSSHAPFSREGAVIFVKLRQMATQEKDPIRIDTSDPAAWHRRTGRPICPLFSNATEQVSLQHLGPGEALFAEPIGGAELLVLAGAMVLDGQPYERGGWMRFPVGESPQLVAGARGACLYLKTGHLIDVINNAG